MRTLRDEMPYDWDVGATGNDDRVRSMLDVEVIEQVGGFDGSPPRPFPSPHRNVYVWWRLKNGYAVAFNENPSVGWSFPLRRDPGGS